MGYSEGTRPCAEERRVKHAGMRKPDVSEAAKVAGDRNVSSEARLVLYSCLIVCQHFHNRLRSLAIEWKELNKNIIKSTATSLYSFLIVWTYLDSLRTVTFKSGMSLSRLIGLSGW